MNKLFFGDNLDSLREHGRHETVYLDPSFRLQGDYNIPVHVVEREKASFGFFVTLADPSRPMKEEAIKEGYYDADRFGPEYPKLQILTIEALMSGTDRPRYPDLTLGRSTFKQAGVEDMGGEQGKLL